jgi:hypothetical protein
MDASRCDKQRGRGEVRLLGQSIISTTSVYDYYFYNRRSYLDTSVTEGTMVYDYDLYICI